MEMNSYVAEKLAQQKMQEMDEALRFAWARTARDKGDVRLFSKLKFFGREDAYTKKLAVNKPCCNCC